MALGQKLRLKLEDGTELTTKYDSRELRAWEAKTGKSAFVEPMSVSMLSFLGWAAAKRDGQFNGQFDRFEAFDKVLVDVEGMKDDPPVDPPKKSSPTGRTRKTASAD